jgi:hypothetical protein
MYMVFLWTATYTVVGCLLHTSLRCGLNTMCTVEALIVNSGHHWEMKFWPYQGHVQDLKKGGAEPIACEAHVRSWPRPSLTRVWINKEGCFRPSIDEKLLFRERILEAKKFIVGLRYQLLIISNNSCHSATELAVVPDLRGGVLKPPELPAGNAPAYLRVFFPYIW